MRPILIALAAALFAALPAAAQDTQPFHSTGAGYTVQLPAAWRRMPDAEIDPLRRTPGMPFTIEAGYRVTDSPTGLPLIALAWMDLGVTITREQFAEELTGADAQADMQVGADNVSPDVRSRVDAPVWDAQNGILWSRIQIESSPQATPFTWIASMLHPGGRIMLVFSYYGAPGEDEARVRADLLAIVRSLRVD
jgi:hypothetical protein